MRERTKKLNKTQLALFNKLPERFYLEELAITEKSPAFIIDANTNEVVFYFEREDWCCFNSLRSENVITYGGEEWTGEVIRSIYTKN